MPEIGLDPNFVPAQFDFARRYVIRPEIKGADARKIEPRVVLVAGQNAVLDAATVERKTHMRTAVVQGKDSTLVFDNQNGSMRAAKNEPPFALELLDRACAFEFGAHGHAPPAAGQMECRRSTLALLIVLASGLRQSRFERGKEASCFASRYDAVIEGQRQRQHAADDLLSLVDDHA